MARERALDERWFVPRNDIDWVIWRDIVGDNLMGGYAEVVRVKGTHINDQAEGPAA